MYAMRTSLVRRGEGMINLRSRRLVHAAGLPVVSSIRGRG